MIIEEETIRNNQRNQGGTGSMKKIVIGIIVLAAIIGGVFTVKSMRRVGQGEVGVVYSMKDGVQEETLSSGNAFCRAFLTR